MTIFHCKSQSSKPQICTATFNDTQMHDWQEQTRVFWVCEIVPSESIPNHLKSKSRLTWKSLPDVSCSFSLSRVKPELITIKDNKEQRREPWLWWADTRMISSAISSCQRRERNTGLLTAWGFCKTQSLIRCAKLTLGIEEDMPSFVYTFGSYCAL